jgi:hypothetical protein
MAKDINMKLTKAYIVLAMKNYYEFDHGEGML